MSCVSIRSGRNIVQGKLDLPKAIEKDLNVANPVD